MADVEVTSTSTNTVDVVGLNDIKAGITLGLVQPFKTEGVNTYEIKPLEIKPLTTTSTYVRQAANTTNTNTYDVKPLKTDSSLARRPQACSRRSLPDDSMSARCRASASASPIATRSVSRCMASKCGVQLLG